MKQLLILLSLMSIMSCSGGGGKGSANNQGGVKLDQYVIEGQKLYTQRCSNCHQPDGKGLASLYPPLNQSDFIKNNKDQVICIIKNGISGEIEVNGKKYNQMMPPNADLTDLEIAEIVSYLYNTWGLNEGIVNVKEVNKKIQKCTSN